MAEKSVSRWIAIANPIGKVWERKPCGDVLQYLIDERLAVHTDHVVMKLVSEMLVDISVNGEHIDHCHVIDISWKYGYGYPEVFESGTDADSCDLNDVRIVTYKRY